MSIVLCCNDNDKNYTYQHLHGVMLVNLNKIAYKLNLTHSEYRLAAVLITFWNKKQSKSFPSIDLLASHAQMGKQTVIKNITKLVSQGIITVVKGQNGRNNYLFSNCFFENSYNDLKPHPGITCKTSHKSKPNRFNKNKSFNQKNDAKISPNNSEINILSKSITKKVTDVRTKFKIDKIIPQAQGNQKLKKSLTQPFNTQMIGMKFHPEENKKMNPYLNLGVVTNSLEELIAARPAKADIKESDRSRY